MEVHEVVSGEAREWPVAIRIVLPGTVQPVPGVYPRGVVGVQGAATHARVGVHQTRERAKAQLFGPVRKQLVVALLKQR